MDQLFDEDLKLNVQNPSKATFKLFDFFANFEYFETTFNYDEVIKLPRPSRKHHGNGDDDGPVVVDGTYEHLGSDALSMVKEESIGCSGMKIDRMFFETFEEKMRDNKSIADAVEAGHWDRVTDYVNREVFNKPEEYYTLDKLRRAAAVDRRLTLREILEKAFGLIPHFKSKDELLDEEFAKFVVDYKPDETTVIPAVRSYFKAYATNSRVRDSIDSYQFTDLVTNPVFSISDFRAVPEKYRGLVPEYIKDYVPLNQFAP